jgi:two-component system chemotaxis response regulator CheY
MPSISAIPAKKHILVIEDGPLLRRLLAQLLEQLNYSVTTAINGREGVKSYHSEQPDLVITDIFMPEMDGLDAIRQIRGKFPSARFIAMSGASIASDLLAEARRLGARHTFLKPFDTEELISAIQEELPEAVYLA